MAQVTGVTSGRISKVLYSTNYSDYTDLSGGANSIKVEGGDRKSGEAWTFDGDTPIVTPGKLEPLEVTFKSLYVDSSVGHFAVIYNMKQACTPLSVRWNYDSSETTGSYQFTSTTGYVTACNPPNAQADPGDPLGFEWTVKVPDVADAVIA